jgi:hypothetical protein
MRPKNRDHLVALAARVVVGTAGVLMGLLLLRSLPDLVRYVKMERM